MFTRTAFLMLTSLITSIFAFISTNIDDIFILILFYGNRKFRSSDILFGQYLGIGTLVTVSFLGAFAAKFVDQRFIGILGLFPIYLALKQLFELLRRNHDSDKGIDMQPESAGLIAVAGVTIANGADNLGVYIPLLTTMTYSGKIQLLIVFTIMTYIWCALARFLASRPLVARQLDMYGHVLMPLVLFFLGIFILFECNTLSLLI